LDAHGDMLTHAPLAKNVDQAIAVWLRDLKSRGMLDETLVVWTTEFGRTRSIAPATRKAASIITGFTRRGSQAQV